MKHIALGLILTAAMAAGAELPNILWVSIEDTGPEIGAYGDTQARTPNIDKLADQGVTFLNAFAHAPVCAVARSGIITGIYPTSIGTHNMRSRMVPPPHVRAFPEYLRARGYYTTNNSKTDYNFFPPVTAWDENSKTAHWKNRPDKDQPFFAVFNLGSSHESAIRRQAAARAKDPSVGIHDAAELVLPPYFPDTPKVREAWASYYDVVTITDRTVGELIAELDEAGLRENTLVIFWGDHGAGLARAKRWLYDSGVKVPIIARWPGKVEPGSVRSDLVQFLDFPPTMLAVAGIDRPDYMDGRVILGDQNDPAPERLYFGRDRMDERYDMIRGVRDHRFKYIRNFESHKPWVQFMRTPSQGLVYQELGRLKEEGKLDHLTGFFMQDTKPFEELYDTLVDPYEMHNLAANPNYREVLSTMRGQLVDWMTATNDHGLVPEPELYRAMYPENKQEVTTAPKVQKSGGLVRLIPATEGASIAYTLETGDGAHWLLYSKPVSIPAGKTLRAKAIRLGFEESAEVAVTP